MTTNEFSDLVDTHSLLPNDIMYSSNALCGEAGECANQVKKITMAITRPEWVTQVENKLQSEEVFRENLKEELSDVLFYLTRLGKDIGISLEDMMVLQANKLAHRTIKYKRTFLK